MQPQAQLTIEQALQNLDTVCANTNGNRETHLVLMAGLELVKQTLDRRQATLQSQLDRIEELAKENSDLKFQLAIRYEDNAEPTQQDNEAGQVLEGETG